MGDPAEVIQRSLTDWKAYSDLETKHVEEISKDIIGLLRHHSFAIADLSTHAVVPKEPTPERLHEARRYLRIQESDTNLWAAYQAMINHKDSAG